MKVAEIAELGITFKGGNADNDLWVLYPSEVTDTLEQLKAARKFIKDSGSLWAVVVMKARTGQQEVVRLYTEQEKALALV